MIPNESDGPPQPNVLRRIKDTLVLPAAVTTFETSYLRRMNRIALWFFYLHLPIFLLLSWLNDTGPLLTLGLTIACLVPPTIAYLTFESERAKSIVFGFTSMCIGAVLVHIGQGPVQIEMHFYFFSVLAMLALFGNPMAVVVAAATVSVHHVALWFLVPASVFNYDAPIWVVFIHALFVVLETVAACFIARNFFDNVIGLEKKVEQRTLEIQARNRDMRLVLDNVRQGLVTAGADGQLAGEHSSVLAEWFGPVTAGDRVWDYLGRSNGPLGEWLELGWSDLSDGFLPRELALEQLPRNTRLGDRHFAIDYQAIDDDSGNLAKVLLVISDVTADLHNANAEAQQRETLALFEHVLKDRAGLTDFLEEGTRRLEAALQSRAESEEVAKRHIHTLKGNAGVYGMTSIARLCHDLETHLDENELDAAETDFAALEARWDELRETSSRLLGNADADAITMTRSEHARLLRLVLDRSDHATIASELVDLQLEPTEVTLGRFADHARALAQQLAKGDIEVDVQCNGLRIQRERFAAFWSTLPHVLRNAVDHGLEVAADRMTSGKPEAGRLGLTTRMDDDHLVLEISDDGRGIDWDEVRARADELHINYDAEQPTAALFAPGFSTKTEATEVSGRGVGLSAVRAACSDLEGEMEIESEQGRGTMVRFRFPKGIRAQYPKLEATSQAPSTGRRSSDGRQRRGEQ